MAGVAYKISVGQKVEETLQEVAKWNPAFLPDAKGLKIWSTLARQLLAKIEDAKKRKEAAAGINPFRVVEIIREVLGRSVVLPPSFDAPHAPRAKGPLLALVKQRINFLQLTEEDVERAATRVKHSAQWRKPIQMEFLIRRIDVILAAAEEEQNQGTRVEATTFFDGRDQ